MKKQILTLIFVGATICAALGQTYRMGLQPFYENNYALVNPAAGFLTGDKFFQNTFLISPEITYLANQTAYSSGWGENQMGLNLLAVYYPGEDDSFYVPYVSAYYSRKVIENENFSLSGGLALQYDETTASSFNVGFVGSYKGLNVGVNYMGMETIGNSFSSSSLYSTFGVFASYNWEINNDWKLSPLLQYSYLYNTFTSGLTASYQRFSLGAMYDMGLDSMINFNIASLKASYALSDTWSLGYALNGYYENYGSSSQFVGISFHSLQVSWKLK